MPPLTPNALRNAAELACLLEVNASKPGNVTPLYDFQDTTYQDFLSSALAIGPVFGRTAEAAVGETVLRAIQATRRVVKSNTNLGIVLLLAPLAKAAATAGWSRLRSELGRVLRQLSMNDAELVFEAIRLASPSGMGKVEQQDVAREPQGITLLQAMELAKERDSIAREYVTDYEITFGTGLPVLQRALQSEDCPTDQAIVHTFLSILAKHPDSLIARKEGAGAALRVSEKAKGVIEAGSVFNKSGNEAVADFDKYLRERGNRFNPGTTADLTAAAIFLYLARNLRIGPWRVSPELV